MAAGGEVGRHHSVANTEPCNGTPDGHDLTYELVADDRSWLDACKFACDDV
jgi:hypothetical protein